MLANAKKLTLKEKYLAPETETSKKTIDNFTTIFTMSPNMST